MALSYNIAIPHFYCLEYIEDNKTMNVEIDFRDPVIYLNDSLINTWNPPNDAIIMNLPLNSLDDMKQFAKHLTGVLYRLGYSENAKTVEAFSYNSFTTSSEYLGELRIVLKELIQSDLPIEAEIIAEVKTAIQAIDRAFGQKAADF